MTSDNGWDEYRKLFEQEMEDNRAFRKEVREWQQGVNSSLTTLKTQRSVMLWVSNIILPAGIAGVVAWFTGVR